MYKPFGTEPALIMAVISSALALVVTFNIGLTSAQAGLWTAVIAAVGAAVTAALTRPIAPAAFTGLVGAVAALLAGYHFDANPATIGAIDALITSALMLLVRHGVSPVAVGKRGARPGA
jgi:hypothetical protein